MSIAGLFSGIGGLELPFHRRGEETSLLCDKWDASRAVLGAQFNDVPVWEDISDLEHLPDNVRIVTAGFPCTDLSQAGRTAGISGEESGLVSHVFRLLENRDVEWLVLENVRNMLALDKGKAMTFLVSKLEELGFSWAYRLVNSQFTGVPQRRHRVIFVASRHHDPRRVLFADNSEEVDSESLRDDAFGFYWTEGLRGLGWAKDAIPPLKGGSALGIPSPPGIWLPNNPLGMKIVTPTLEDSEALQGFERGWTAAAQVESKRGARWKLVGNAVSVGVSEWLVDRLYNPGDVVVDSAPLLSVSRWPDAAYGCHGQIWKFDASHWPLQNEYTHLTDLLTLDELAPLSFRATSGFFERTKRSSLRFDPLFLKDIEEHIDYHRPEEKVIKSPSKKTKLKSTQV